MSHCLQPQTEITTEERQLQTEPEVSTFVFSCKLWCTEVDILSEYSKLEVTFCKHNILDEAKNVFIVREITNK